MKSLTQLLGCVLADASTWCRVSTTRDLSTIERRFEHEGLSFLTIALPAYCASFERSLADEQVSPDAFLGFKKRGALPQFLGGLLDLVFERNGGRLLDAPSQDAIFFIRQITLMFKKVLLPCSETREKKAYEAYVECEYAVREWERSNSQNDALWAHFESVSTLLWSSDLTRLDRLVYDGGLVPKHGPGATADKQVGNDKYQLKTWHERLEGYFPLVDYAIPNSGFHSELESIRLVEPDAEMPVRVITVPKTLKSPRIIAIEPTCMQYTQQALMEVIVDQLERSDILSGSIGFTDQVPNQELARIGSIDGSLATIDLSEASDRVSNLLVNKLFSRFPSLAGAIQASRSLKADVPGYGIISLSKFASMGSATCFPVEAMVFLTIVCSAYARSLSHTMTKRELKLFLRQVRVYGDDIIIPAHLAQLVCEELSTFGLKVNSKKSFWTGKFRESCGKDYYAGHDVSVTYVRRVLPSRLRDVPETLSAASLRNQLYEAGLWGAASYMDHWIRRVAPFPNVLKTSPAVGRFTFLGYESQKMCQKLFKPLVKAITVRPRPRRSVLDGPAALLKYFLKRGFEPIFDKKHLERYGRPLSVDIKIGWYSPY